MNTILREGWHVIHYQKSLFFSLVARSPNEGLHLFMHRHTSNRQVGRPLKLFRGILLEIEIFLTNLIEIGDVVPSDHF